MILDNQGIISKSKKAVYSVFFIDGVVYACWLDLLPVIQLKFQMNNSILGLMLFSMSLGSMLSVPFVGYLIGKYGSRKVLIFSFLLLSFCYLSFSQIATISVFFVAVFIMGCSVGAVDISMNVQAFKIEYCNKRSMMTGFHASFSLGMIIGAFVFGFILKKMNQHNFFILIAILILVLLPWWIKSLQPDSKLTKKVRIWVKPRKKVILLGLVALGVIIIESSLTDWNTTYMSQVFKNSAGLNTTGLVAYSFAILLGRAFGDKLRNRIKDRLFLWIALFFSGLGLFLLIVTQNELFALIGFTISGLGISVLLPTIFSIAGNHWPSKPALGISMVASISYFGYLLAPILMGILSDWRSIQFAYYFSLLILMVIVGSSFFIKKRNYNLLKLTFMKTNNLKKAIMSLLVLLIFISSSISAQKKNVDYSGNGVNNLPLEISANIKAQILIEFNKAYLANDNVALREAACNEIQFRLFASTWQPGDLFAGRITNSIVCILPQPKVGYVYSYDDKMMNELLQDKNLSASNKDSLLKMKFFWAKENTKAKLMNTYTPDIMKVLPSNNYIGVPGVAFPLYRISGAQMDFDKLVHLGILGLQEEIDKFEKINTSIESQNLYKAMHSALNTLIEIANYYAAIIEMQKKEVTNKQELADMDRIVFSLKEITKHKPNNFFEAIQLCYLYAQYSGSINYGRMDEYLGNFYQSDLTSGMIVKNEAIRMFCSLFKMMEANHRVTDSRVIIGGKGRRNEKNADQLALVIMEAMNKYHSIVPQLTLRFYQGQDKQLYKTALDIIGSGYTYPMLYNDDVIIPSVQAAFNVSHHVAINYLPYGCGEYIIYHKSMGTPSGLINLLTALNVTLHNGVEPLTGKKMGLALGNAEKFKTFKELMDAYKKQVEYYVTYLAKQEALEYKVSADNASLLYLSMLFDDCIANGKALLNGGVRYLGGTLETYGNTNTADALAAIKFLVYDKKVLTLMEVVHILDVNFVGYDKERNMMLNAPKYGNDNDYVDSLKVEVDKNVCEFARSQNKINGLHSYLVVSINNSANTLMGLQTAASADGREERTYMANANTPTGGADKDGITAMLNSIVKPSTYIHAGSVQNIKFSKELFAQNREKVEVLLNSYWKKGGAQAMLNVLGRGDLEDAMIHPEKYTDLVVRVGGFCARFVELPQSVQLEIISRVMY